MKEKDIEDLTSSGPSKKLIFPFMALLAGILGGLFGIGGGMLISPLLLHVGIPPEVIYACSFSMQFIFLYKIRSKLSFILS